MAFVAISRNAKGEPETIGVVRTVADPDNHTAELSIVVRSDLKRRGLGTKLLGKATSYCRSRGTRALAGDVLAGNESMLELSRHLGWSVGKPDDEGIIRIAYALDAPAGEAAAAGRRQGP